MPATRLGLLACAVLSAVACEMPVDTMRERVDVPVRTRSTLIPPAETAPSRLKVMTWNIKYGAGRINFWFDSYGDRVHMTREEVEENMAGIYALINEVKPDILLTNELEIDSQRSAYYDMVQGILEHTDLNYAGYAANWVSAYIPNEGLGRMNMGNAIFSRYPITRMERIPQADRTDQDPLTTYYYLHRTLGRAEIDAGGKPLAVYVVHTEAYDQDRTILKHLQQIDELMAGETREWLVGGDFNAIPPTSVKVEDFNDDATGAYQPPPYVLSDMQPFYDQYLPAVTLAQYGTTEVAQSRYYTHSLIGPDDTGRHGDPGFWTRTLDYLWVDEPSRWVLGLSEVLQEPGRAGITSNPLYLSDHCPVIGTWEFDR